MAGELENYELPTEEIQRALASKEMPEINESQF